ncbi:hypothetical protein BK138_09385 [Paenibacillus rhizosphaerae]|uniref:Uncharacterized protein n=1 Tax=Paenibacillus rhizosphaerae TaxID=297318 RepID=A0A1R1F3V1_9BACL|nr:hypothetical protein [Paenibacillus rhizosphaerae]OMF58700.1 hypothetical protein BK138_09385 [Paenibacillus rhizosphaerae]
MDALRPILLNMFPEARASSDLLKFLVQLLSRKLNDSSSALFLPNLIKGQRNPTYDPYHVDRWSIPGIIDGMSGTFTDLAITGISNAGVKGEPTVDDDNVISGSGVFLQALKEPKSIHVEGNASLIQDDDGQRLNGTFTADIYEATVQVKVQLSADGDKIQASVQQIALQKPDNLTGVMKVAVKVDPNYDEFLNDRINQPSKLELIYQKLQGELSSTTTLKSFSDLITKAINNVA